MRRPRISLVLPSLLALLAAGCDATNLLQPEEVAGEYVLESLNGSPLPAVWFSSETATFHVLADTLRLGADRLGSHVRAARTDYPDARPDEVHTATGQLSYRIRSRRIEFGYTCPPTALCTPPPHTLGRLDGSTLVVVDGEAELRYRRL